MSSERPKPGTLEHIFDGPTEDDDDADSFNRTRSGVGGKPSPGTLDWMFPGDKHVTDSDFDVFK